MRRWLPALVFLAAFSLSAHTFYPVRSLRLQLRLNAPQAGPAAGFVEGLLTYTEPAGAGADLLFGIPQGMAPGERAGGDPMKAIALRLAPEALRGLRLGMLSATHAAGSRAAAPELLEANARKTRNGGVEAAYYIRFAGSISSGAVLRLELNSGIALPVELLAPTGTTLRLISGLGKPIAGGLALNPRPEAPCVITYTH